MISLHNLLQNPNIYREELKKRFMDTNLVDRIIELEDEFKPKQARLEALRKKKNEFNKIVNTLSGQEKQEKIQEMKEVSDTIKDLEAEIKKIKEEQQSIIYKMPNLTWDNIPIGPDDSANTVTDYINSKKEYSFTPKPYYELEIFQRDYNSSKGIEAAGYRGYYITGEIAMFQRSLYEFVMERLINEGFKFVIPPIMVKEEVMYGTGFFPSDQENTYQFDNHGKTMYLTGTSEGALMFLASNQTYDLSVEPLKFTAQTRCFRAEAGKHGTDTKGGMRVHEFEKIETVVITDPDKSQECFNYISGIYQSLIKELGIYAHNLEVSSGDISLKNHRQIDIEGYFPSIDKFKELCSSSNCTDYQTRNLNIKVINKDGEKVLAHSLNCTGVTNRLVWCIMEQFQNEDGTVTIPEILVPKFGKTTLS